MAYAVKIYGPFCGKPCAGRYGAEVQHGKRDKLPPQKEVGDREYYYFEKARVA